MKVLCIQPHIFDGERSFVEAKRVFPWGFASVATALAADGHQVEVLDIYGHNLMRAQVLEALDRGTWDCVCITGFASMNFLYVLWLTEEIKKRFPAVTVIGGKLSDLHHELLLARQSVDVCVLGEGEITAVELLRRLDRLDTVRGIAYRRDGAVRVTPPREAIGDLDGQPLPDFGMWDMQPYLRCYMWVHDSTTRYEDFDVSLPFVSPKDLFPNIALFTGRGCPYRCTFCSRSMDGVRLKSVERIMREVAYFKEHYGIRAVHFADELLVLNKERTLAFCKAIKKMGVYWDCQGRINTVDGETLAAMKDAGCLSVGFGVESGSDRMLKAMRKGISRKQILSTLKAAEEVGMHLKLQFMVGYPGETRDSLEETASLFGAVHLPPRRMNWCTPMPGSELYDDLRRQGRIPDEEEFVLSLHKGWNKPGRIIFNASGLPDQEMERLYQWVHIRMEWHYLLGCARRPRLLWRKDFLRKLTRFLGQLRDYHAGVSRRPRLAALFGRLHRLADRLLGPTPGRA